MRRQVLIAIACLLVGCAERAPAVLERSASGLRQDAPRILIAPVNLSQPLSRRLEAAVPILETALLHELERRGARIGVIYTPDALTLWNESVHEVAPKNPQRADRRAVAVVFAKSLATGRAFDALLLPSLVLRDAQVVDHDASWDGVQRPAQGIAGGSTRGLSLQVIALMPGHWRVQERYGGLELLHGTVSPDLLSDPANVAEGVALALDPIFGSLAR